MHKWSLLFLGFWLSILTGCSGYSTARTLSSLSLTELATRSSKELCTVVRDWPKYASQALRDEISRRNLGDCSPEHLACLQFGFTFPSLDFAKCRQDLAVEMRRARAEMLRDSFWMDRYFYDSFYGWPCYGRRYPHCR